MKVTGYARFRTGRFLICRQSGLVHTEINQLLADQREIFTKVFGCVKNACRVHTLPMTNNPTL